MNNLEAAEKAISRISKGHHMGNPVIHTDDLLRAFRAYHSEVEEPEELRSGPEPELTLRPGDRCPTCGWGIPDLSEGVQVRMSPGGEFYVDKPEGPKPETLSEDEYRLLMLRAVWELVPADMNKRQLLLDLEEAFNRLRKRLGK